MIQALADQLGQDEDVTDVGTDNQEKLRELLK